eukprot:10926694-Heterocapsa_arctica.AAC.1
MDFTWKSAMTRHGISSTWPAKKMRKRPTKTTTPGAAGGPWGAAGGGAVVVVAVRSRIALAGDAPKAPVACRCAPLFYTILYYTVL